MTRASQLRQRLGLVLNRVRECVVEISEFLKKELAQADFQRYLNELMKLKVTLTQRLASFMEIEEELIKISDHDDEEADRLTQRNDDYFKVPLDARDLLAQLSYNQNEIEILRDMPLRREREEEKEKHEFELTKEREGWKLQFEEL